MKAENKEVAVVKAITGTPEGTIVNYGGTIVKEVAEQTQAIRQFVRGKVLKQFGITGINGQNVSQLPLGFGEQNVNTGLKLPRVNLNVDGSYAETLEAYYKRALPAIQIWFKNCLHNSPVTVEAVATMD